MDAERASEGTFYGTIRGPRIGSAASDPRPTVPVGGAALIVAAWARWRPGLNTRAGELLATVERSNGGRGKTQSTLARVYEDSAIPETTGKRWQAMATVPDATCPKR